MSAGVRVVDSEARRIARLLEIKDEQIGELVKHNMSKKSPFRKWVQMNSDEYACRADDWLIANSPAAYRIFKFLISHMDHYNAVICSYKVIQEKFGYGQATVARAVKLLKEHNFISVVKSGTSNVYMINKGLYWNSWGTNYAYAKFDANVIISASEQDEAVQKTVKLQEKKRREILIKEDSGSS